MEEVFVPKSDSFSTSMPVNSSNTMECGWDGPQEEKKFLRVLHPINVGKEKVPSADGSPQISLNKKN